MDEQSLQRIRKHLQSEEARKRVQQNIQRGREDATVTIGRAAQLFGFSENQLRDWEIRGLLKPRRSKDTSGQRQYVLAELDKLAVIRELLDKGGYTPSTIPPNVDEIWDSVLFSYEVHNSSTNGSGENKEHLPIDRRVEQANKEEFWRYFVSHALHLSLNLICEDIPDAVAGIVLPLRRKRPATVTLNSNELSHLGECLIGWIDQNHAFHTFYDPAPIFEVPSDFRVRGLIALDEQEPQDSTFIVLQRKERTQSLPLHIVETVRRLLAPIYEDVNVWRPYFGNGMRDVTAPFSSFSGSTPSDATLTDFANLVIRLGGQTAEGQSRWKLCCFLLPDNPQLPLQLRSLTVRAQSERGSYAIGRTTVSPDSSIMSLSQRAFQSSHCMYRPMVSQEDSSIIHRSLEEPIRSVIAMPVGGEDGIPVAVLYIVSEEFDAFPLELQRVLRVIGRMVEELILIYQLRQKSKEKLRDAVEKPRVFDKMLEAEGFLSENSFARDVQSLLYGIQERYEPTLNNLPFLSPRASKQRIEQSPNEVVSFISVDVDNQSTLANKYGDQMSKNLSKVLAQRIKDQVGILFDKQADCRKYYAYADRFYLMLNGKTLEQARENAEKLRQALGGTYYVSTVEKSINQPRERVKIDEITVRLGVTSYTYDKLFEVLHRYPSQTAIADMQASILHFLNVALNQGKQEGGNVIISWYPAEPPMFERGRLALWSPKQEDKQDTYKV